MNFIKPLYIFLFLLANTIYAQKELSKQMKIVLEAHKSNKEASLNNTITNLNNLLNKYKKSSNSPETGILFIEISKLHYENGDTKKCVSKLQSAIQNLKRHKKGYLKELNRARNNLSWIYKYEGRENEQYQVLKEIIDDKGKDEDTFNATINLSIIESNHGDYYHGLNNLNTLLAEQDIADNEINVRINIIKIYAKMYENDFGSKKKSELEIIKKHHSIIDANFYQTYINESQLYSTYNNLANIYDAFGYLNLSLELYLKAKNYYLKNNEKSKMLDVTNNIGYLYSKQKKGKLAIQCFNEVIKESDDVYQIATAYDNLGYFLNTKSTIKKIPYFEKAIQTILEKKEVSFSIPSLKSIKESGCQQDIFIYLVDLADHYLKAYKETNTKSFLLKARETLYLVDELVSLIRYESNSEQSKLFWIEKGVNTYMLAVETCYLLNKPDEAFYFMEKNKALLLQENIKMFQAKLELDIPKKTLELEYKLHYELSTLEKQFQKNPNDRILKQKYSAKNKEFQVLKDLIKRKHPKYSELKEKIDIISIDKAISNLTKDECFITYILTQNDGYGIFCNQKEKIFFKINDVISFQKNLKTLKELMNQRLLDKNKTLSFKKLNYSIFKTLFPFDNALSKIKNKKIRIVPDDTLLDFPFEALITSSSANKLLNSYLVNYAEVSYFQSFSVFEKIKQKKNHATKKLLAIAPIQFEDKKLNDLLKSEEAMSPLKKYQNSTILIGKKATKENFSQNSKNYEILHLNTHGGIDSLTETPWISFRKDKLTLNELYGIDNQSELVILDACKTNDGTIASGEGILSLTRGFFNNGAKSVLASLWNVNEKAGNEIITSFYTELEEGKSKAKALQLAKIKYLKKHQYSESLPYYWASFTLTGSTEPIELSESCFHGKWLIIIITTLLFLLVFIYYKRKVFLSK